MEDTTDYSTADSFKNNIFKINPIEFQGIPRPICMQSENGPCPLIAILNCLLLSGELELEPTTEYITGEDMVNRLLNFILEKDNNEYLDSIIDHFKELQTGLLVNVKFSSVLDFEECSRLHIFDYLGIKLYHGWLMDPQVTPEYDRLKNYSYDEAAEYLVPENDKLSPETKHYLCEFINSNQLTYPGLCQLNETMNEKELGILFHNNHFSVIYKQNAIYLLSTDIGYSEEPGVVWQLLNSVNGDTEFVNEKFEPIQSSYNNIVSADSDLALAKKIALEDDYMLAMELQERENESLPQQHETVVVDNQASSNENSNVVKEKERQKDWSCRFL